MSQFSKWKTIGYAAAIFTTGGISGGALGVYKARTQFAEPQHEQEIALHMKKRFETKLGLTPDQVAKVDPILDDTAAKLVSIRADTAQHVGRLFEDSYVKISAVLTPAQRVTLDQMEKERKATMDRWQENHHHPGPGGAPDDDHHPGPGGPPDGGPHDGPGPSAQQ